jgi:ATP-dependent helicase/DNAse subunit B
LFTAESVQQISQIASSEPDYFTSEAINLVNSFQKTDLEKTQDILYSIQKIGFDAWQKRNAQKMHDDFSVFGADILAKIQSSYCSDEQFPKKMRVSSTALKNYYYCGVKWIYESVLKIQEAEIDAELMKDTVIGNVYHAVLKEFFTALITTGDTVLLAPQKNGNLLQTYYALLQNCIHNIFNGLPKLKGSQEILSPLNVTLLQEEKDGIVELLSFFLAAFFDLFAGYSITASELPLHDDTACEHAYLFGIIDCVLQDQSSVDTAIIDFKKSSLPLRKACVGENLEDFQLPMYVRLAEANKYPLVTTALFMNIVKGEKRVIFGSVTSSTDNRRTPKNDNEIIDRSRDKCNEILETLLKKAEQFACEVRSGKCSTVCTQESQCFECTYRELCRTSYIVAGKRAAEMGTQS